MVADAVRSCDDSDGDGAEGEIALQSLQTSNYSTTPPSAADAANAAPLVNPMDVWGIWSQLTWSWVGRVLRIGAERPLQVHDLDPICARDRASTLSDVVQREWTRLQGSPSQQSQAVLLWQCLWAAFGVRFMALGLLLLLYSTAKIAQPLLLLKIVDFVADESRTESIWVGLCYALALPACSLTQAIVHHLYFFETMRMGMHTRWSLATMIYHKALQLTASSFAKHTAGQLTNLLSSDSFLLEYGLPFIHYLWNAVLETAVGMYILYRLVGVAAFAGLACLLTILPFQIYLSKQIGLIRKTTLKHMDARVKSTSEMLQGAEIVKMYAWEEAIASVIVRERTLEFASIRKAARLKMLNFIVFFVISAIISLATFSVYVKRGNVLEPGRVFATIAMFNLIKLPLTLFVSMALEKLSESVVAMKRIARFLSLEQLKQTRYDDNEEEEDNAQGQERETLQPGQVVADCAAFAWTRPFPAAAAAALGSPLSPKSGGAAFRNLSFRLAPGELLGVGGSVGAGKSSLLSALLGEMLGPLEGGSLRYGSSTGNNKRQLGRGIAYAPQTAWIQATSIRENIIFGRPYERDWYATVIAACELTVDFAALQDGDQTQIGEQGINLSGGQRARISLARAVYASTCSDLVLLDDPLSAVDAVVGKRLFHNVILGTLREKTTILVTHHVHLFRGLEESEAAAGRGCRLLIMDRGNAVALGTFSEIEHSDIDIQSLLHHDNDGHDGGDDVRGDQEEEEEEEEETKNAEEENAGEGMKKKQQEEEEEEEEEQKQNRLDVQAANKGKTRGIIQAEDRESGVVDMSLYWRYFRNAQLGIPYMVFCLVFSVLGQAFLISNDAYLAHWSSRDSYAEQSRSVYPKTLTLLTVAVLVTGIIKTISVYHLLLTASAQMHNASFRGVLFTAISFFHANPVGRILNRFAKDQSIVDEMLPWALYDTIQASFMVMGALLIVLYVNYWTILALVPVYFAFSWTRRRYLASSREVKRLDSITRSPVYSHFSSSISGNGLVTIRAFGNVDLFGRRFLELIDENTKCFLSFLTTSRWLGFRLDAISCTVIGSAAVSAVLVRDSNNAGNVGFALSTSIGLTALLQWMVRQSSEVENLMTSCERIMSYASLPEEGQRIVENNRPPTSWPAQGAISFRDVKARYRPSLPLVLKGLTFDVAPGQKVGIVGRTGAGKSSLASTLFRLLPLEHGQIVVDGIDINSIGLLDLRDKLSIIPQTPVLFSGTLRRNLDPFLEHSDAKLAHVIAQVELDSVAQHLDDGLDTAISEGGSNLSAGEAQLVCIARALLKDSKILLLDEASSQLDGKMDRLIQRIVRRAFTDRTVLTIAHRLNTIIDYDIILVLDHGLVREFGPPQELLRMENGVFAHMAAKAGLQPYP